MILHRSGWYFRWPAKLLVLGLTILLVCFPYPGRTWTHFQRWRAPNELIEPDAPELAPLLEEVRERIPEGADAPRTLKVVERYVYERLPYAWDWETWGMSDYIPTVHEALAMGREDCDGRAVVAASMLAKLGFESQLVTDFAHVWVKTERGETMSPGKRVAVVATDKGLQVQPGMVKQALDGLAYGTSVFPVHRQAIIMAMIWFLLLSPRIRWWAALFGAVLLIDGWLVLRLGGRDYRALIGWAEWVGVGHVVAMVLLMKFARVRRVTSAEKSEPSGAVAT
jgi:hypothetical protein